MAERKAISFKVEIDGVKRGVTLNKYGVFFYNDVPANVPDADLPFCMVLNFDAIPTGKQRDCIEKYALENHTQQYFANCYGL